MNRKIKVGLTLFLVGLVGILSMLTTTISLDELPKELTAQFSAQTIQLLLLINPTILLLIAVVIGTLLYDKVALTVPAISSILNIDNPKTTFPEQLKYGIFLGIIAGALLIFTGLIFKPSIPEEFVLLENKVQTTAITRLLYGGLTEEILMRYGFMTLVVWVVFRFTKKLSATTYWIGIGLATIVFAIGHFPIVFSVISSPPIVLLLYVLIGNSIAGLFFGWLYWKKGLEAAFIGHILRM